MRIFYKAFFSLLMLICLNACQKNIDLFVTDPIQTFADTVWQNNLPSNAAVVSLKNELKVQNVTDSFFYANAGVVFSSGNISLTVPANGLIINNGTVPAGIVKRESLLIHKKGAFIAMNMPTTINGKLLITGGAFFLGLKNNNNALAVSAGNKLTVRYNNTVPVLNNYIYNAIVDSITGLFIRWEQNIDTAFNRSLVTANGYEIQTNRLQYVQTAHLLDTAGIAQTTISLKLPPQYTNTNTVAYVSFNNIESVAGLTANVASRKFLSSLLPVNKPVTMVVISKQGSDYYLGTFQTVTNNLISGTFIQEINIVPVKKSLQNIKTYLDGL